GGRGGCRHAHTHPGRTFPAAQGGADLPVFQSYSHLERREEHCHAAAAGQTQARPGAVPKRSEEHTSELQSRFVFVCRLLLEKKKVSSSCAPRRCLWTSLLYEISSEMRALLLTLQR